MKIDKKYIVIAVCILIGGVLTATLAFIGPDIITNGTINPNNVVTGNLKLKITDTSITLNNMAPIRSSNYETEAFKKEFTISNERIKIKEAIEESAKCVMLCANCHREVHDNIINLEEI